MSSLFVLPQQFLLNNVGALIPGAKAYFFAAGTSTAQTTYTEHTLSTAHSQPILADGNGRFPAIYLDETLDYKVQITDSSDVEIYTQDFIQFGLTATQIAPLINPRTQTEINESITPVDYLEKPGNVRRYGAVGDGLTNDTSAFDQAFRSVPSTGGAVVVPAGNYLLEPTVDHPFLGAGLDDQGNTARFTNAIGVLIANKNNISVFMEGAVIEWTDAGASECGVFTFQDCTNVNIYGGKLEGEVGGPSLYMALGSCTGFRVFGAQVDAGRAIASIESDKRTAATTARPKDVYINGSAENAAYGAFIYAGSDITLDIKVHSVNRALWVGSVTGVYGVVTGDTTSSAALNINPRDDDELNELDLYVDITNTNQGVLIRQFDNTPTNPTTIKNVRLRGRLANRASDGLPVVQIGSLLTTSTLVDTVDLSELKVEFIDKTGGASSFPYGVLLIPDVAATIKNVSVGDITCPQAGQVNQAFRIDNTNDATIECVRIVDACVFSEDECVFVTGTTDDKTTDVLIEACRFDRNSTGNPVRITKSDRVHVVGNHANQATIDCQSSNNVTGGNNVITGISPTRSGALTDTNYVAWTETYELTSGSATITSMTGIAGQQITLFANGGTQTFTHGVSTLVLDSDVNVTLAVRDSLTLKCLDGTKWVEVSRKS